MIDKQQFNDTFQNFEVSGTIEILDMFFAESKEYLRLLEHNISDNDLVGVKWNVHKLGSICGQLGDPVALEHGRKMEEAAREKVFTIIDILLVESPGILENLKQKLDGNELYMAIYKAGSINAFLSGYLGSFSTEKALKLQDLEKRFTEDGIPQMFADLKTSTLQLVDELILLRKELAS